MEFLHGNVYIPDMQQAQPKIEVARALKVHKGPTNFRNVSQFNNAFEQRWLEDPLKPQVLRVCGEPGGGKLTSGVQFTNWQLREGGPIRQLAERQGFNINFGLITWGDPFEIIPSRGKPPIGRDWKLHSMIQVEEAAPLFEIAIAQAIDQAHDQPQPTMNLLAIEIVGNTGLILDHPDGHQEVVEVPRAVRQMQNLSLRQGDFQNLDYELTDIMIAASPEVLDHSRQFRRLLSETTSLADRTRLLQDQGLRVQLAENERLEDFGEDEASPDNMAEIASEIDATIYRLYQLGLLKPSAKIDLSDPQALTKNPGARCHIVWKDLNRIISEAWYKGQIPPDNVVLAYNDRVLPQVTLDKAAIKPSRPFQECFAGRYKQLGLIP